MRDSIMRTIVISFLLVVFMLCQSCTAIKCETQRQSCKWDCPTTIAIKQVCEQACNVSYDLCKRK
jgi:hypothetical protein